MAKLRKGTLALTFKYDRDRFLRFRLLEAAELKALGVEAKKRPAIQLVESAGSQWEYAKYCDLLDTAGEAIVHFRRDTKADPDLGGPRFVRVTDLFSFLLRQRLPAVILEAEFPVPSDMVEGLEEAYASYGLETAAARPDILWIRPAGTGSPLIGGARDSLEYEIHIVDVKMAAEPTLRHFAEVTYYALALARALEKEGLAHRFAVSAEGFIWPGTHDTNAFRTLFATETARGVADPLTSAFEKTLVAVPYEVYQVHVRQFFSERLLRVLAEPPLEAGWHVSPTCQTCEFLSYCMEDAEESDHLSLVPGLNQGQAQLLRTHGITSVHDLVAAIEENSAAWQAVRAASQQLRTDAVLLHARAKALTIGQPVVVSGRKSALMPSYSNMSIYLTVHFDPGSGISFALGAMRVYFPPKWKKGDRPEVDRKAFVVDRVNQMNPDTERKRLAEFIETVTAWLLEADQENRRISKERAEAKKAGIDPDSVEDRNVVAHIFFWDSLEVRQLKRMIGRHMEDLGDLIELLVRLFPPDGVLPDPDTFTSQPGTVVKDVVRQLVGLPIRHDYTLLDVADIFYPDEGEDGEQIRYLVPYGFKTALSDQIPFERAYELWVDKPILRKYDKRFPNNPEKWPRYTRDELYEELKRTVQTRLRALEHVVSALRKNHGESLTLYKSHFSAAPPTQSKIPERARKLIAFERLNAAYHDIENRQRRALPIDERESRFLSIRGLVRAFGPLAEALVTEASADARYAGRQLLVFAFSPDSRDARIKEGDFLLALSNESLEVDLDRSWRSFLGLNFNEALDLLTNLDFPEPEKAVNALLRRVLGVEVARLRTTQDPPLVVLVPKNAGLFGMAQQIGLLNLDDPLVLDPVFEDFTSKQVNAVMRSIGGNPPPMRRRAKV